MTDIIVGYFCWVRTMRGGAAPQKYDKIIADGLMSETRRRLDEMIVPGTKRPLMIGEWRLSLDDLAAKYPCPNL